MDETNNPQVHIGKAIGHLETKRDHDADPAACYRAQAEAEIAIAMLLSGIGSVLETIAGHLATIAGQSPAKSGPFGFNRR